MNKDTLLNDLVMEFVAEANGSAANSFSGTTDLLTLLGSLKFMAVIAQVEGALNVELTEDQLLSVLSSPIADDMIPVLQQAIGPC